MLKRQQFLSRWTPQQVERMRDLVSFRARVDTIVALMPLPHVKTIAREFYQNTPESDPPRGSKAPVSTLISKIYSTRASRLALNEMCSQWDDLIKAGFPFVDALVYVYKAYIKKNHHIASAANPLTPLVRFEHFFSIVTELDLHSSMLQRCTSCGSRNFLVRNPTKYAPSCVICDLIAVNKSAGVARTASVR